MTFTPTPWPGVPIIESVHVPPGTVLLIPSGLVVDARPITVVEYHGRLARWLVRRGMADVLAWLGEDVGPEPQPGEPWWFVIPDRTLARIITRIRP